MQTGSKIMTIPSVTFSSNSSKVGFTSTTINQKPINQGSSKFHLAKYTIDFGTRPPFYTFQILPPDIQGQPRVKINKFIFNIKEAPIRFGKERVYFLFAPNNRQSVGILVRDSVLHPGDDYTVQFNGGPKIRLRRLAKL
jgi:hypothetical protein